MRHGGDAGVGSQGVRGRLLVLVSVVAKRKQRPNVVAVGWRGGGIDNAVL